MRLTPRDYGIEQFGLWEREKQEQRIAKVPCCDCQSTIRYKSSDGRTTTQLFAGSMFKVEATKEGTCKLCGHYVTWETPEQLEKVKECRKFRGELAKRKKRSVK